MKKTGEVYPGLMVAGTTTVAVFGLCRMGLTFRAMLLSDKRVEEIVLDKLTELTYV